MASYRGHNASILSYFRHIKKVPAIITSLSAIITRIAYSLGSYSHLIFTSQFTPYPSHVHRNETSKRQTLLFPAVKLPGKRLQLVHREQGQASTSSIPSEPTNASCTSCTRHTGKQFVSFAHNIYCMSLNVKIT